MSNLQTQLQKIREGFHPTFWVANGMELFERLAFYGQKIVMSLYLRDRLGFTETESGQLSGMFGGMIYLLPIIGGTLADKWGFKRAFSVAFTILALGYFLVGSVGMTAFQGLYENASQYWLLMAFLFFTAVGGSFIKPSVLGTVAVTSTPETKSLGYAIYYWLVNIGAAIGPTIAYFVRDSFGMEFVYVVSSLSCLAMLVVNIMMYKEVKSEMTEVSESLAIKLKNLVTVMGEWQFILIVTSFVVKIMSFILHFNVPLYVWAFILVLAAIRLKRFMVFLLIYSLYWIMFWQEFIILPYYIVDFIDPKAPFEFIQSWSAAGAIILLQIPVNYLTKHIHTRTAILVGFAVSSLCWLIIGLHPSIPTIVAGIVAFALGEIMQAPRYYEYISEIAPPGQQGLFQGYAFLPIAIALFVGDPFGGWIYENAKHTSNPEIIFFILFGVGVAATLLMAVYNVVVARQESKQASS